VTKISIFIGFVILPDKIRLVICILLSQAGCQGPSCHSFKLVITWKKKHEDKKPMSLYSKLKKPLKG